MNKILLHSNWMGGNDQCEEIELFYNVLVDRMKAIPHHSRKLANFMILAQNISWFRIKRKLIFPWNILWIETWVFRYAYGKFWWSIDIPHSTMEGHALQAKVCFFKNRRYRDAEEKVVNYVFDKICHSSVKVTQF